MICKIHRSGASFCTAARYCLGDKRADEEPGDELEEKRASWARREISERVAWTETVHLSTDDPHRAARVMAATSSYAPELKQLAGVRAGGRRLETPVCHYSLSWQEGEQPDRDTMVQAARQSLTALGMENRQALLVAHRDGNCAHVHVVANRVSWEDGRAAKLSNSRLELSRWAERYERERGGIQCERRVDHNRRRGCGERVIDREGQKAARYHRRARIKRTRSPSGRTAREALAVAVRRVGERKALSAARAVQDAGRQRLDARHREQWSGLYGWQKGARERLAEDSRTLRGRARQWRQTGRLKDLYGAIRGRDPVVRSWARTLDEQHTSERAKLGRSQGQETVEIDRRAQDEYRQAIERPVQLGRADQGELKQALLVELEKLGEVSEAEQEKVHRDLSSEFNRQGWESEMGLKIERERDRDGPALGW